MAQMLLSEHLRSGRGFPEVALVAAAGAYLWWSPLSPFVATLATGGMALLLTVLVTYRLTGRANSSIAYVLIVRPLGRGGYLLGAVLAAWVTAMASYAVLRLAAWPRLGLDLPGLALASLPTVLALSLVMAIIVFLSPLVMGTEWMRTALLILVALSVYREELGQWNEYLRQGLLIFWETLVVPVLGAVHLSMGWEPQPPTVRLLAVMGVETVLLLAAALVLFAQRDLDWD